MKILVLHTTSHISWHLYEKKCWCYLKLNALLDEMIIIIVIAELLPRLQSETFLHEQKQYL